MNTRFNRLTLLVLLAGVLALGTACKKKGKDDKKDDGDKDMAAAMAEMRPAPMKDMGPAMAAKPMKPDPMAAKPMQPDPKTPATTAPVSVTFAKGAGPVYFGTKDTGLVMLDKGKFASAFKKKKWIKALALAKDGTLYIAAIGGVFKAKGGTVKKIGGYRNVGTPDFITIDPKGGVWTVSYKGVGHYDGTKWTVEKKDKIGDKVSLLKGIAVDAKGRVMVASSNALHVRENNVWKTLDISNLTSGKVYFKRVALSPTGAFFAASSGGLLKYDKGQLSKVPIASRYLHDMAMGNDGQIYLRDMYKVYVLDAGGKQQRAFALKDLGVNARRVDKMAGDATGRLWLITDHGLVIVDKAGKAVQWEPGVFREIAGQLTLVHPVEAGPATLPVAGKKITGNIRGIVVRKGKPVAKAGVELCGSPSSFYRGTPCAKAPWKQSTTTNDKGEFTFKTVPVGPYGFAIKAGAKWTVLSKYFSRCCTMIQEGKTHNIGKIKLRVYKKKKKK